MNMIELRQVSKRYGGVQALHPVDLSVRKGEFVTLLGPSGSGKTTLLNLIAGMVPPSTGRIVIDGRDVTTSPPSKRQLGMVFQNYALMPHMTVFENIAFPLRVRRLARAEIERKVREVLELVRLPDLAARKPRELSGGQQQRVSLARCIVYNPALILLDEPLGALDKKLREQMQLELRRIHAELGITMVNVTHDQDEALTMSDRIVLMNGGRIEQEDKPEALYFRPATRFAADFIGTANLLPCDVRAATADGVAVSTVLGDMRATPCTGPHGIGATNAPRGSNAASLLIRPESIVMHAAGTPPGEDQGVDGVLEDTIILGGIVRHHVRVGSSVRMVVQEQNRRDRVPLPRDAPVRLTWSHRDCLVLD
ncbi:spermidine/putrescine ABC transporter ATP-binding protein [Bordetella genomosp. 8]|uniref:Spermidine/putrescine import ATP-binding protein PotA n=1 Tax=Bordetella genomosp. 8 TaxID=1416806 RepID=A0A1W6YFF6_9BORD|nr:ABC transporter ATP-binding protein [Bordetella genomosp. 8]ARP79781.1 spermidine/putrescine ABC transporter ATP-binding protein [Bordetella genomosp. 8]